MSLNHGYKMATVHTLTFHFLSMQSKARLGSVVHKKTATVLAFTEIRKEDQAALNKLKESIKTNFNDRFAELNRRWGGGIMGAKTVHKVAMYEKQKAKELATRMGEM